jgi:formylglycine-generating enzyme required for sulfatase activity
VNRKTSWKWAIPTEDEWYKAAYYKGGSTTAGYWDFATHSYDVPGRNMGDASGNNANYYSGLAPYPIETGKYTTLVGEFQNSASAYGTFDQSGNVFEWNEAKLTSTTRGYRGGSFNNSDSYLAAWDRQSGSPITEEYSLGFRVVQVPEPASMVILVLGSAAVLMKRLRRTPRRGNGRCRS